MVGTTIYPTDKRRHTLTTMKFLTSQKEKQQCRGVMNFLRDYLPEGNTMMRSMKMMQQLFTKLHVRVLRMEYRTSGILREDVIHTYNVMNKLTGKKNTI